MDGGNQLAAGILCVFKDMRIKADASRGMENQVRLRLAAVARQWG